MAMGSLPVLGKLLGIPELEKVSDSAEGFRRRDELKRLIADRLREHSTEHWLSILDPADIWCSEVLDWPKMFASEGFKQLQMVQTLEDAQGLQILTTRLPIRFGHEILKSRKLAPKVGEHTEAIKREFGLG